MYKLKGQEKNTVVETSDTFWVNNMSIIIFMIVYCSLFKIFDNKSVEKVVILIHGVSMNMYLKE